MNISRLIPILIGLLLSQFSFSQDAAKVKALNNYVQFTNESIHGMLIIHRMLENFNQEVNKYVDLQSNQLNFYGNKDLPKHIFVDPEHWFYELPPYDWYTTCKAESAYLNKADAEDLNASLEAIKTIIDRVNKMRFTIDDFITANDLSQEIHQIQIYSYLENCVTLYDYFYQEKEELARKLARIHSSTVQIEASKFNATIDSFKSTHTTLKELLEALHFGFNGDVPDLMTQLKVQLDQLKQVPVNNREYNIIVEAVEEALDYGNNYINKGEFEDKYRLYGKNYYYHNIQVAAAFNRYGSGMVKAMNRFMELANPTQLFLLEEPHYYKVIYPKKDIEVPNQETVIETLPTNLKEREVVVRQQEIQVDEKKLLLEIFDHRKEDGDIISLNFNGHWIMEQKKLEKRPFKILVELNEEGENYILLHAENLGDIPPNTIAIRYVYDGVRKLVVLNSDLNESEMIRINYKK